MGQDVHLSRFISVYDPVRRRQSKTVPQKTRPKQKSATFFLTRNSHPKAVCKRFFITSMGLSRGRVDILVRRLGNGEIIKEKRGGDRKSRKSAVIKQKIKEFINKFDAVESHYNRSKSKRIYLSSELSVAKLRRMYNDSVEIPFRAKKSFFRSVFITNFNIGFQSPSSDACTYCTLLKNKIKTAKDNEKVNFMTEKRIHSRRAKAFYDLMKIEEEDTLTFCFDLQQVQPLPRTPIQEAFYSRQVSFYVFCIVGKDTRNPLFYNWTELQANRGATEIGSALLDFLKTHDFEGIHSIRLFCDGCGGQNKNSHIVHVLLFWLQKLSPENIRKIKLFFPVRGHSFLPADRVFGRVQKELTRHPIITTPEEYTEYYSQFGTVKKLGSDWKLYNIKELETVYKKITGIQNLKRITFVKTTNNRNQLQCHIKTFENYIFTSDNESDTKLYLLKRQKSLNNFTLTEIVIQKHLNLKKKNDVRNLLVKQFGEEWAENQELSWYVSIMNNSNDVESDDENDYEHTEDCNCLEHEIAVRI